jgi:hypothetical protein
MDHSLSAEDFNWDIINCEFLKSRAEKINWSIFNTESASSKLVAQHIDSAYQDNPKREPQITNTTIVLFNIYNWVSHKFCLNLNLKI